MTRTRPSTPWPRSTRAGGPGWRWPRFGWAHYFLLLGIVIVAAGIKKAVGHAFDHLTLAQALALAGGLAVYLLGDVAFRRVLAIGRLRFRAAGAVLALATVPVGLAYAGVCSWRY